MWNKANYTRIEQERRKAMRPRRVKPIEKKSRAESKIFGRPIKSQSKNFSQSGELNRGPPQANILRIRHLNSHK